jgi:hypothetical protein
MAVFNIGSPHWSPSHPVVVYGNMHNQGRYTLPFVRCECCKSNDIYLCVIVIVVVLWVVYCFCSLKIIFLINIHIHRYFKETSCEEMCKPSNWQDCKLNEFSNFKKISYVDQDYLKSLVFDILLYLF